MTWPALPVSGFISGRAATNADVEAGNAVFALKTEGDRPMGVPVKIAIPQYAIHMDAETGKGTPGFIIQAEKGGEITIVGFLQLPERTTLMGTLAEFKLLGTKTPSTPPRWQ
ncbi:MAG: hypothetical protein EXR72_10730 [Myxococcales bacterium]|nr:hypothetical protein [Myxococcales bacterium]